MNLELKKGERWKDEVCRIDIWRLDNLAQVCENGKIDGHKIVEVESIGGNFAAVKTIGWRDNQ